MAKVRSPNYPSVDLSGAIELVRPVFKAENRNKLSKSVLAKHMGYTSLNGRALAKIGAVRAYGLIEGSGDELRLTDDAIVALAAPSDGARNEARLRLALKPQLFQDLRKDFPDTLPSEDNIAFWLIQRAFTSDAAGKAAKTYLATMRLAAGQPTGYIAPEDDGEDEVENVKPLSGSTEPIKGRTPPPKAGMIEEIFMLDEGPVTLTFPSSLSGDSYQDLADHVAIFLRKAKRRSEKPDEGQSEN
jgi:hypothetical protein